MQNEIASRDRRLSDLATRLEQTETSLREAQHSNVKLEDDLMHARATIDTETGTEPHCLATLPTCNRFFPLLQAYKWSHSVVGTLIVGNIPHIHE
jgi:hypothetical protein